MSLRESGRVGGDREGDPESGVEPQILRPPPTGLESSPEEAAWGLIGSLKPVWGGPRIVIRRYSQSASDFTNL